LIPLLSSIASAFCGTYVGGAGAALTNVDSQVVIARSGNQTTLTLASDVSGDVSDFALLVPVLVVLGEGDVTTVDPGVLDRIDTYGAPRLVEYTCDNLHGWGDSGWYYDDKGRGCGFGCDFNDKSKDSASGGGWDDTGAGSSWATVDVEAEYTVGAYDIVVLSAEEAGDLLGWLGDNGYAVSADAEAMIQAYLDQGVYFFAARVSLDATAQGAFLEPLQFTYASDAVSLPIRLGTLNSEGSQDVVIHVIGSQGDGVAGISNYPQIALTDECMWAEEGAETFAEFAQRQFDADFAAGGHGAAWAVEHSWGPQNCDPCTGTGPMGAYDLFTLGSEYDANEAFFTRLHVRTTPAAAVEDLTLYFSGREDWDQQRFIRYSKELESDFPICGQGWVTDDPGTCEQEQDRRARAKRVQQKRQGLPLAPVLAFLALVGAALRRTTRS
jgi:hypothetical protein